MPYKANFRCPLCGDSQKSKVKARGWFRERDNHAYFLCYNGCQSRGLPRFLEEKFPHIYKNYIEEKAMERFQAREVETKIADSVFKTDAPKFKALAAGSPLLKIKKISSLPIDHPARKYVVDRLIPPDKHFRLYYTPKFKKWVNSIIPDKMENLENDEPRLILPFIDQNGILFGFQGRSFNPDAHIRYITIMMDEDHPKIFGLDQVKFDETYYVFEGPIDSFFVPNTIAMAGSTIHFDVLPNPENAVFVFDNEPRKPETVAKIQKAIDAGFKVSIWDSKNKFKDVNDMVKKGGMGMNRIKWNIDSRTFSGLEATLELNEWKKV